MDNASAEKTIGNPSITSASIPMSRVEQYVIYLNTSQTYSSQNADQQLMEQFQRVIKESRFSATLNGPSQLSLTLRPDNLGEMMVRLTHVNGEMTVKIIVTSEATKEMLQSNIHQLKNMFSPQQVIIERQELTRRQARKLTVNNRNNLRKMRIKINRNILNRTKNQVMMISKTDSMSY